MKRPADTGLFTGFGDGGSATTALIISSGCSQRRAERMAMSDKSERLYSPAESPPRGRQVGRGELGNTPNIPGVEQRTALACVVLSERRVPEIVCRPDEFGLLRMTVFNEVEREVMPMPNCRSESSLSPS
ncbi:MAG: hypothetical protein R6V59_07930 [Dehalococcoidia bacterium]